jgi:hypothetical protein
MLKYLKREEKEGKRYLGCRNSISNSGLVCFLSFDTFSSQFVNQLGLVNLIGDKEGRYLKGEVTHLHCFLYFSQLFLNSFQSGESLEGSLLVVVKFFRVSSSVNRYP